MDIIHDIWKYIAQWLNDNDRYYLMITNQSMMTINLTFTGKYQYTDILMSSFFHCFESIKVGHIINCIDKPIIGNQKLFFPKNLRELHISSGVKEHNLNCIPSTIVRLSFGNSVKKVNYIPSAVKYLSFYGKTIENIPESVTHFECNTYRIDWNCVPMVKYLTITDINNIKVPSSVTHLKATGGNRMKDIHIPPSVSYLFIGDLYSFSRTAEIMIPPSVTQLILGPRFNKKFKILSKSLTHLTFGEKYNFPLQIPSTVTHLTLGADFQQELDIPLSISHLFISNQYQGKIPININVSFDQPDWIINDIFN